MTGFIKPQSAIGRVRCFFETNPEETLTRKDIEDKFDLDFWQATKLVNTLQRFGFLRKVPGSRPNEYEYTGVPTSAIKWRLHDAKRPADMC